MSLHIGNTAPELRIAKLYDMIPPDQSETAAVRSEFIIDPAKKIRLTMTYPMSVGRNFDEILQVIDSLQSADRCKIATPADWRPDDKVIIPPSFDDATAPGRLTVPAVQPFSLQTV